MRGRSVLAVLLLAATGACSLSFDPRGYSDDPAPDASPDVGVAAEADAGAPNDTDAAARFCRTEVEPFVFCADFDEAGDDYLSRAEVSTSANLRLTMDMPSSPPHSLLTTASGAPSYARLKWPVVDTLGDTATLAFDQLVTTFATTYAQLSELYLEKGGRVCHVRLQAGSSGYVMHQACYEAGTEMDKDAVDLDLPVDLGTWHRFVITVHAGAARTASIHVDGVEKASRPLAPSIEAGGEVTAFVGVEYLPSGVVTLAVDNVVASVPP